MGKYRGSQLFRAGFIGAVLMVLIIAVGMQPDRLLSLATAVRYQALFTEAGGLAAGDDVTVSGIKVGSVSDVSLRDGDALVSFTAKANVPLGAETTAHIRTATLLGQRALTLDSAGGGRLHPMSLIPVTRTSSPYLLSEAQSDLTRNTADTETQMLNRSLDTLSETIDQIAPQLGPAFDGLTRLSRTINGRNQDLRDLLGSAGDITGILSERSQKVNTLILNANDFVTVLAQRRQAIVGLLANTSSVAQQLNGLVGDNEKKLAPTLDKLNAVIEVMEKNKENIGGAMDGLAKYALTIGEAVGNGHYYSAFVPNLLSGQNYQWIIDYLFGFRSFNTERNGYGPGNPSPFPRAFFFWPLLENFYGHP